MRNFYITFGENHKEANGNSLRKCYTVIEAMSEEEARKIALRRFGQNWAGIYDTAQKARVLDDKLAFVQFPHL